MSVWFYGWPAIDGGVEDDCCWRKIALSFEIRTGVQTPERFVWGLDDP